MKRNKTLDWIAGSVVALTVGGVALSMGLNWEFTVFFLIPLVVLVTAIGWTIGWATHRCYRMWNNLERIERGLIAKATPVVVAVALIVVAPLAKAMDDNLMGGYAGIYTHTIAPRISIYWGNWMRQIEFAWHEHERNSYSSSFDGR